MQALALQELALTNKFRAYLVHGSYVTQFVLNTALNLGLQENKKILSDLTVARQAARQAEHLVLEQALELDRAHITNSTLAQVLT